MADFFVFSQAAKVDVTVSRNIFSLGYRNAWNARKCVESEKSFFFCTFRGLQRVQSFGGGLPNRFFTTPKIIVKLKNTISWLDQTCFLLQTTLKLHSLIPILCGLIKTALLPSQAVLPLFSPYFCSSSSPCPSLPSPPQPRYQPSHLSCIVLSRHILFYGW